MLAPHICMSCIKLIPNCYVVVWLFFFIYKKNLYIYFLRSFEHPYQVELDLYHPPSEVIGPDPTPPAYPTPLESTRFTYIDSEAQIDELVKHLNYVKELAVDVEHHSYRTYQGMYIAVFNMTMQIKCCILKILRPAKQIQFFWLCGLSDVVLRIPSITLHIWRFLPFSVRVRVRMQIAELNSKVLFSVKNGLAFCFIYQLALRLLKIF